MAAQLRFGDWCFCPDTGVLDRDGTAVALEPRVARLLEYFLENSGELLSHDQLVAVVWDDRAVSDDAIRRAVSSLRHTLAVDGSDKLITTVHKKGYLANLPPVESELSEPPPLRRRHVMFPAAAVALLLLLALVLAAADAWLQRPADPEAGSSELPYTMAVLPFVDLSEAPGNTYLADGLAEELLALLGRFSAFRVSARSSSFQFRDQTYSPREVGEALGVRYLVEGSVRVQSDQVRINVRLIKANTGFQLWSGDYSHTLSGLFALQAEIATEVARALQVVLVKPDAQVLAGRTQSAAETDAYLEYLQARRLVASFNTADLEAAIAHLHNAIALAPDFAPAYVQLAQALLTLAYDDAGEKLQLAREVATPLIARALELDPELGEAYAVRAGLYHEGEEEAKEADLRRSIALKPSYSMAYQALAEILFFKMQRRDEALELIDRARTLDPLRPRNHHIKAYMMLELCQLGAAAALAREALRVNPRFRSSLVMLGSINDFRGELAEAVRYREQALALDPDSEWVREKLHNDYLDLGDLNAARQLDASSFMARWRERLFFEDPAGAGELVYSGALEDKSHLGTWAETYSVLAAAMATGDYQRARRYLEERFQFQGDLPEPISRAELAELLNMVLVWYGDSRDERYLGLVNRLYREMTAAQTQSPSCPPWYQAIAHALAAVTLGHHQQAIAQLQEALVQGETFAGWYWLLEAHPGFAPLLADPDFEVLKRGWEQNLATQRARLEQLRREGSIPDRRAAGTSPTPTQS